MQPRVRTMPDLTFQVETAAAVPFAAAPMLSFRLRIANSGEEAVYTACLRCQIQIEAAQRRYSSAEQAGLQDLFGHPNRWHQTLRTFLWTHASVVVPQFSGSTVLDLQIPCTFDVNLAFVKYFRGLKDGDIPLCFQFSGTVFYEAVDGGLRVAPISWDAESKFRLPVKTWNEMMDAYYPNSAWLYLRRDVFERLQRYKIERGVATWEQALEDLLENVAEEVRR